MPLITHPFLFLIQLHIYKLQMLPKVLYSLKIGGKHITNTSTQPLIKSLIPELQAFDCFEAYNPSLHH